MTFGASSQTNFPPHSTTSSITPVLISSPTMDPPVPKSRRHLFLVVAFKFVAWLLIVTASISIAVLVRWYVEKAEQPKPISMSLYSTGWISILLNFVLVSLAFDGMQRAIQTTGKFVTSSCAIILSAVLAVETLQLYFYHTVTRPDQLFNYSGTGTDYSEWLYWAAAAFAGPIIKLILILIYGKFADSQEHYVKAHVTVDVQ